MERARPAVLLLAALPAACAAMPPAWERPPRVAELDVFPVRPDLRTPALLARGAVERILGRPVPAASAEPLVASREEFESAVAEELRPQVDMLHPGASAAARDTLLRATAGTAARSAVARYSPERRRIFVAPENLSPQMQAAGLEPDRASTRDFLALVLAHEMVHAADDEVFGIGGLYRSAPDAESLRAVAMVVEGRAVHYARRAAEDLGLAADVAAVLPGGRGEMDERRARWLLTYREGAAFVAALEARAGAALAERPLADPPRLTSTLFHPARYGESGEERGPDLAAALAAAGFAGAAAASELDLRARWLPRLGEEAVARAFAGFVSGAGLQRGAGGVSVSLHETPEDAAAYASSLRPLYGLAEGAGEGTKDGLAVVVQVRGRAVASALDRSAEVARRDAEAALAAAEGADRP
jgi:hypothetical protein